MISTTPSSFDVIVVGGGIIGMLTARNLQLQGMKVAIMEKGELGNEASWAAAGILSPLNPWKLNSTSQALVSEGQQMFPRLANELHQETNIDSEFYVSGMLVLETQEKDSALVWAKKNNTEIKYVADEKLYALEPGLSCYYQDALYFPKVGQIRSPKLMQALKASLQYHQVKIYEHTLVKKLAIASDKIQEVIAEDLSLYADRVVLCNGAWAANLLPTFSQTAMDIEPVRGQMLLYKPNEKLISRMILKEHSYLVPRQDGHILCGSTMEHVGFNNQTTTQAAKYLHDFACELIPELHQNSPLKQWSGLRPGTQQHSPYVCEHPEISGLYLNTGHFRYGIVMSIASARIMSDLVVTHITSSQTPEFA